ncbi:ANTAR domain-containing response regulator [Streptomyces radicis]|uniref:ANTAR domain-containing protein n=1 Tax=Streptomyces radicis TaxID=1750517 RepID=A0A3A9VXJ5_9ACTN|nr:GAF and ANTAR domain-containing protein [Streptomyces radicis]RKN05671.1 ANTAR domain-containing protein [Streptomyces radicis]RKN17510.1 ANTAR domain-containing protein [Streptomyces radicis]
MSNATLEQPVDVSARSLVRLAEEAALCAPGTCGAAATLGGGDEPPFETSTAVTHPDLAPLLDVQAEAGEGPVPTAMRTGEPAGADDLLAERRWPAYRALALERGVRSSVTLPFRHHELTVTVTLCGFRPGLMDARTRIVATLIGDLATRTIARDRAYERALTEVDQLDTALRSRPVIDQACGILMHVLGCDADAAFDLLRRQSQRTNSRLADLAERVVATKGAGLKAALAR